jgi:hypothetical protein
MKVNRKRQVREWASIPIGKWASGQVGKWASGQVGKWAGKKVGKGHASRKEGDSKCMGKQADKWACRQISGQEGR